MARRTPPLQLDLLLPPPAAATQLPLDLGEAPRVNVTLRRSATPRLRVRREGDAVAVTAPRGTPMARIEEAVRDAAPAAPRKVTHPPLPATWGDGEGFAFLGHRLTLRLDADAALISRDQDTLVLPLTPDASPARIRDSVHGWLQNEARHLLEARLAVCAQKLGLSAPPWKLSFAARVRADMKDGMLRAHWKLVLLSVAEIDATLTRALTAVAPPPTSGLWDNLSDELSDALSDDLSDAVSP